MNIWELLDIAPTTDKKAIRRAYAARSKVFHPEEKPEEFRQLYEAYQAALTYARLASAGHDAAEAENPHQQDGFHQQETFPGQENPRQQQASPGQESLRPQQSSSQQENSRQQQTSPEQESPRQQQTSPEQENPRQQQTSPGQENPRQQQTSPEQESLRPQQTSQDQELLFYFAASQARQKERLAAFYQYWEESQSPYKNPPVLAWWQDYLASEDFQSIRWNPDLVQFLAENIERKFYYGGDEIKLLFWDAYGFREEEEDERKYQGDLLKLRKCLCQALENQKRELLHAQRQLAYEKKQRLYKRLLVAGILFVLLLIPLDILYKQEGGRRYLSRYMARQYPGTEFSQPKRAEKLPYGKIRYHLHSLSHPDLLITADVTYRENDRSYQVSEDYSPLLLKYYASQYGLACGQTVSGYSWAEKQSGVLYYPDIDQLPDFCETVTSMFQEHKELAYLTPVGFCGKNLLFPDVLLQGGVYGFSFPESQFYEPWTMNAADLEAQIREAFISYMFLYEAWNLTPAQYEQWGNTYEKLCENWTDYKGTWYNVTGRNEVEADNLHETSRTYLYYHTTRPDTVETDGLLEPAPTSSDDNATHPDTTETDDLLEPAPTSPDNNATHPDATETDGLLEPAPTSPDNNATHPDATETDGLLEPAPASSDDNTHYGKTGETLCHVYLPVYSYVDSYTQFGNYSLPGYARNMTIGSAWYYLTAQGADVTVNEDGSGFSVRFQGNVSQWGDKPAVDFDELENWY